MGQAIRIGHEQGELRHGKLEGFEGSCAQLRGDNVR